MLTLQTAEESGQPFPYFLRIANLGSEPGEETPEGSENTFSLVLDTAPQDDPSTRPPLFDVKIVVPVRITE